MTDNERVEFGRKMAACVASLYSAVYDAGGDPSTVVPKYLERPLSEFLAGVAAPNGIRFHHEPEKGS